MQYLETATEGREAVEEEEEEEKKRKKKKNKKRKLSYSAGISIDLDGQIHLGLSYQLNHKTKESSGYNNPQAMPYNRKCAPQSRQAQSSIPPPLLYPRVPDSRLGHLAPMPGSAHWSSSPQILSTV